MTWALSEPPSGFEPETYALRDHERSCCVVPCRAAPWYSCWSEHMQRVDPCRLVLHRPKASVHRPSTGGATTAHSRPNEWVSTQVGFKSLRESKGSCRISLNAPLPYAGLRRTSVHSERLTGGDLESTIGCVHRLGGDPEPGLGETPPPPDAPAAARMPAIRGQGPERETGAVTNWHLGISMASDSRITGIREGRHPKASRPGSTHSPLWTPRWPQRRATPEGAATPRSGWPRLRYLPCLREGRCLQASCRQGCGQPRHGLRRLKRGRDPPPVA